jgi:regulator of extracellular matrix RemA (YlzA/DUF370 family)
VSRKREGKVPSHSIDLRDPKALARLLLALVAEHEGELRLKAVTFDSIDRGRLVTVDYDRRTNEVVLRATSDFGSALVVQPESAAWTKPIPQSERPETTVEQRTARRTLRSDEELAILEESRSREAQLSREIEDGELPPRIRLPHQPGPREQ